MTDVAPNTVRSRVQRARHALLRAMAEDPGLRELLELG